MKKDLKPRLVAAWKKRQAEEATGKGKGQVRAKL